MAQLEKMVGRVLETDVLVIGGGGAGATAAVAAARAGVKVTMAIKGALGRSGNTIMSAAVFGADGESAFDCGERKADRSFTRELLFEKIVKHGYYLSEQDLVQQYVEGAAPRLHELLGWGKRAKQRFMFVPPGSWATSGKAVGLACRQGVRETPGIEVIEDVIICDLLVNENKVVGALGVDVYAGELLAFKAKAVVLSSGGYQPFSFKCTHGDMTGDGIAMAYRSGAELADMEFLLFLPGVLLAPQMHRGSIFPFVLSAAGLFAPAVVNGTGESITDRIPHDLMKMAQSSEWVKLIYTYYWGKEIAGGKGTPNGGVYFDFSRLSRARYLKGALKTALLLRFWYGKNWRYQGEEMSDLMEMARRGVPWEVGLSNQYSLGGVIVDAAMRTGLPGLFAAGEVTSGVFGANRLARALTEMLVQGYQAGKSAAELALQIGGVEIDVDHLAAIKERILRPFSGRGGSSPLAIRARLEATADAGFGFLREASGLEATLKEVERIRNEELPQATLRSGGRVYNYEWIEAIQLENLITCAEAGVRSALMRRESRGFHLRSDYHEVDHDIWLKRIVVRHHNGTMLLGTRSPVFTSIPPPTGRHESVMHYAVECERGVKHFGVSAVKPTSMLRSQR